MRFIDNGNDTVTDTTTNLIWLKDANKFVKMTYDDAIETLKNFEDGKWRLPTVKELITLIDYVQCEPALPEGHPFINIQSSGYWSSISFAYNTDYAWYVYMWNGGVDYSDKDSGHYVWPVRDELDDLIDLTKLLDSGEGKIPQSVEKVTAFTKDDSHMEI